MGCKLKCKVIFLATNNVNKFHEACKILEEYKIAVGMIRSKLRELQSDSLEEIAVTSACESQKHCGLPLIVEDAGLFIEALNGFPGPYAAYVFKTIGNEGLLQLMRNVEDRKARFESVIAYAAPDVSSPICFKGVAEGEITMSERKTELGTSFGFDPIFKPEKSSKTFAEMTIAEKNRYSHRADALRKFAEWYKTVYLQNRSR